MTQIAPHTKDHIEHFHGALIQHGGLNRRIYLMKVGKADPRTLPRRLVALAARHDYTKIFAKVPTSAESGFLASGFVREARVGGLYAGRTDGAFVSLFRGHTRRLPTDPDGLRAVRQAAFRKMRPPRAKAAALPPGLVCRRCTEDDAPAMTRLYAAVFSSYPFPITDPRYVIETMRSHIVYVGIWQGSDVVAVASAEMDRNAMNAEMTDFATAPAWRGRGLARHLLAAAETQAAHEGILTAFTIARARSAGMNIVFARRGYAFGGTLINNTNICGRIESMNVWHKPLRTSPCTPADKPHL